MKISGVAFLLLILSIGLPGCGTANEPASQRSPSTAANSDVPTLVNSSTADSTSDPTFVAVTETGTLAILSTSAVTRICTASVNFSYLNDKQERKDGVHICKGAKILIGQGLEVCRVRDAALIEPRIEGPVSATCK